MNLNTKKLAEILRFLTILILFAIPLHLLLQLEPYFESIQSLVASHVYALLLLGGFEPIRQGYFILLEGTQLEVAPACIGYRSILAFIALLIATPRRKNYLKGLALIPILYGFNLFRLITVLLVNIFTPNLFEITHNILWTYTMTLLVIGLWWYWTQADN